jgi:hypothetical protein
MRIVNLLINNSYFKRLSVRRKIMKSLTIVVLSFLAAGVCFASGEEEGAAVDGKAVIRFVRGEVSINGRQVEKGEEIPEGSMVCTGSKAVVEIVYGGKNIMELRENSEAQMSFKDMHCDVDLSSGTLLAVMRKNQPAWGIKGGTLKVKTPTAVADFTGRAIFVEIEDANSTYINPALGAAVLSDVNGQNTIETKAYMHEEAYRFTKGADGTLVRFKAKGGKGHTNTTFDSLASRVRAPLHWGKKSKCSECNTLK